MVLAKPKKWYFVVENGKGVRCDNEGCDYSKEIESLDELFDYLDVKCPKCNGELPLITKEDLMSTLFLNKLLGNPIIRFLNWLGKKNKKTKVFRVKWSRKGDGQFDLVEK
jgi:phage FluMu protein Com